MPMRPLELKKLTRDELADALAIVRRKVLEAVDLIPAPGTITLNDDNKRCDDLVARLDFVSQQLELWGKEFDRESGARTAPLTDKE